MVDHIKRKSIEHSEQVKLVAYIRAFHPDIIVAAIPNGGNRSSSERLRLAHEGVLAGMPDLCVLEPLNGFHGLFVEMKTKIGVVSHKQSALSKQLNDKGYLCLIADQQMKELNSSRIISGLWIIKATRKRLTNCQSISMTQ